MNPKSNYTFVLKRLTSTDTHVLDKPEHTYTCGRGKENQIVCLGLTVSRQHCIFFRKENELYVTDLKSSNGLFINGVIQTPLQMKKLSNNDVIGIGCQDLDNMDNSMFAYKLCISKEDMQNSELEKESCIYPEIIVKNSPIKNDEDSSRDHVPKRKIERISCDSVIPKKIVKLEAEKCDFTNNFILEDDSLSHEDDIEIVHVSLQKDKSQQSINTSIKNHVNINNTLSKAVESEKLTTHQDNKSILNTEKCKKSTLNTGKSSLNTDSDMNKQIHSTKTGKPVDVSQNTVKLNQIKKLKDTNRFELNNSNEVADANKTPVVLIERIEVDQKSVLIKESDKKIKRMGIGNATVKETKKNVQNGKSNSTKTKRKNKTKSTSSKTKTDNLSKLSKNTSPVCDISEVANTNSTMNQSIAKSNTTLNLLPLAGNFISTGDTLIKMEEELQLTDTDEDALLSSTHNDLPAISPIKLKKVQREPKTRFSEVDVVNLSDNEDDVFPCSQLFDTGFDTDISVKPEIKEELTEVDNKRFDRLDDEDLVISLTDSEDEDNNTWLHRLSRSQILNESKEDIAVERTVKQENEEEISDIQDIVDTANETDSIAPPIESCNTITNHQRDISPPVQNDIHVDKMPLTDFYSSKQLELDHSVEVPPSKEEGQSKENISIGPPNQQNRDIAIKNWTSTIEKLITPPKGRLSIQKKVPEIEPPHLSTGRRSSIPGKLKETLGKPATPRLSSKEKKEQREKAKIEDHMYQLEQKNRRKMHKWANLLPAGKKKRSSLSKEEKKMLIDDRKAKLKQIAMEEKRSSLEENQQKKRIFTKPKAKVSVKTRGDFLVTDQANLSKSKLEDSLEKSMEKLMNTSSTKLDNSLLTSKTKSTTKYQEMCKDADRITKSLQKSLIINEVSNKDKVLKDTSTKTSKIPDVMEKEVSKSQTESVMKSTPGQKVKKRVSFAGNIKTVREYEIEPQNTLKKFVGKDAPIPIEKLPSKTNKNAPERSPKLEEFLLRILSWNPVWLEEQQHLNSIAPVVKDSDMHPMLTHYRSYNEYYSIVSSLLLHEIWCGITKEFENIEQDFRRRTLMCSIVENSITQTNVPSTNVQMSSLMLEVLVTQEDLHKQTYPKYGDLVFFEYVKNHGKGQTFRKVFAYVTQLYQTVLSPMTYYNKDLNNYIKKPYALITYTMMTKPLEPNIPVNRVQRLRTITYLRSDLRLAQGLQYLPNSPLMNLILNPKIEMYQLPLTSESQTCSLVTKDKLNDKQLEGVMRVTEAVVQKEAKLCFIQGPPGTGKSKVIVNIITQILYGGNRYTSNGGSLKILVCAPSNAAIDELVIRLLHVRCTIKEKRFKMVRIGRVETMHPGVKDISLTELAKRDVKRTTSSYVSNNIPLDSVEDEKLFLQARINALRCEIANSLNLDEATKKHIKMKLTDMSAKYELLQNRRPMNELNPKELAKLQRAAENRIIEHADIITCTLSSCYTSQMESIFGGNKKKISVCIVDEATQSIEAETLIPLMLGVKTLVLVGDPNQLPATVISQQAKRLGLDQSIFSRMQPVFDGQPNNPIIMLDTQYRMQHPIVQWPNKFFYGGKLRSAPESNLKFPFHTYRVLNLNVNQNNDKFSNTNEANFVANMITCMMTFSNFDNWKSAITVGVITPYNNQRSMITAKLNEKLSSVPEDIKKKMKIEINTVDGFQGQERDVIIMSCVRTQGIGFLSDRQRLCVALTRAKHSFILCGNFHVFMRDQMWNELLQDARSRGSYFNVNANAPSQEMKQRVIRHPVRR